MVVEVLKVEEPGLVVVAQDGHLQMVMVLMVHPGIVVVEILLIVVQTQG